MGITRNGNNSNQSPELNLRLMVLIVATTAAGVAISTVAAFQWGDENIGLSIVVLSTVFIGMVIGSDDLSISIAMVISAAAYLILNS